MVRLITRAILLLPTVGVQAWVLFTVLNHHKPFKVMTPSDRYGQISLLLLVIAPIAAAAGAALLRDRPWAAPVVALAFNSAAALLVFLALQPLTPHELSHDFNQSTARSAFLLYWLASIGFGFVVSVPLSFLCSWVDVEWFETTEPSV